MSGEPNAGGSPAGVPQSRSAGRANSRATSSPARQGSRPGWQNPDGIPAEPR